jgi:hypothetical protein
MAHWVSTVTVVRRDIQVLATFFDCGTYVDLIVSPTLRASDVSTEGIHDVDRINFVGLGASTHFRCGTGVFF